MGYLIGFSFFLYLIICFKNINGDSYGYTIKNKVHFPYAPVFVPYMGFVTAFSVPLAPPLNDISISYNFEANYNLPQNETEYTYPPIVGASRFLGFFQRSDFYKMLKLKFKNDGLQGKSCILRMICQMSQIPAKHTGVVGDIVDILFRPSTSVNPDLPQEYNEAEKYGSTKKHCKKYTKKCSIDLLGYVSLIDNFIGNIG